MNDLQKVFQQASALDFNGYSKAVFDQLSRCHTAKMGYHRLKCDAENCQKEQFQYHSCGNRHCPNCGGLKREEWIENRMRELLPTPYYHLVFTLPHELNPVIMGNRKALFKLLFEAASETILNHSKMPEYLGADCGITMILHTWGQKLDFHPHVHCIVTGGGFDGEKWVEAKRKNNNFLFPETSMSRMYKAIFLKKIQKMSLQTHGLDFGNIINEVDKKRWNVFAKAPFGGPAQVVEYLGRYSHKIAITKHRIISITDTQVFFRYKDYADGDKTKVMSLTREAFLRRFETHILPKQFTKIRHFGFMQNHGKQARLQKIRQCLNLSPVTQIVQIPVAIKMLEKYGTDIFKCPCCAHGRLKIINTVRYFKTQTQEIKEIMGIVNAKNKASPVG
jgi:Putative transposase/Transposase zinc-binding domain